MIEPTKSGQDLVDEIQSAKIGHGSLGVWRLGQAGIVCAFPASTIIVDAYLSNHCEAILGAPFDHRRLTRAPLDPAEITFGQIVLCSHAHPDHLDPPTLRTLARALPQPAIVAPENCAENLAELGWEYGNIWPSTPEHSIELAGLTIKAFAVPHEGFDEDAELGFPYQGFVITDGEVTIVHLGDALDHPRVRAALAGIDIDVLFVPINGRDAARAKLGLAGNMTAGEAVDFAKGVRARHVIPIHYDTFQQNVDPHALENFRRLSSRNDLAHSVLAVGELLHYNKR